MDQWKLPDARGWIGLGAFILTLIVLALLIWGPPELRKDDFFKALATLIVGCYIKDVVGWAYQATKQGGELAERNAAIVHENATAATNLTAAAAAAMPSSEPIKAEIVNTPDNPANVTETAPTAPQDGMPSYAQ